MEKKDKKIANEELENVTGGTKIDTRSGYPLTCPSCGKSFTREHAKVEMKDDGCSKTASAYQCPFCGTWKEV